MRSSAAARSDDLSEPIVVGATIQNFGDIESICENPSVSPGGTAKIVFRTWDDVSPPFTVKVKGPDGRTVFDRVIRELPTGEPMSAAPISFLVATKGDYKIQIKELYGKQDGEAVLTVQ